eukprot:TRINITY_DN11086_c0_g1_i5.p4 TRINITY_DN11086_c0_g1~~TRINITY_DN11086_c0_g1_i5.p4  ORF type:complete len:156 (+),score=9.42 TRINITY_DN11086_c0_g1_i5:87-554(+)
MVYIILILSTTDCKSVNLKADIRISKPKSRKQKSKSQNQKADIQILKPKADIRNFKADIRISKPKADIRNIKTHIQIQKPRSRRPNLKTEKQTSGFKNRKIQSTLSKNKNMFFIFSYAWAQLPQFQYTILGIFDCKNRQNLLRTSELGMRIGLRW